MYLYRAPNNVYFTRICLAKSLRDKGFPFDVKVSLFTSDRAEAVIRNIDVAGTLKRIINSIDHTTRINDFIRYVDEVINEIRTEFDKGNPASSASPKRVYIPIRETKLYEHRETTAVAQAMPVIALDDALSDFVVSKQKTDMRPLSIKQLKQRTLHFINMMPEIANRSSKSNQRICVNDICTGDAMKYRDALLTQGRSYKSNKEYLAAVFQFFKWCQLMNYCSQNPFENVSIGQKPKVKVNQARERWSHTELRKLFTSPHFNEAKADFKWVSQLMLYAGLRPSEACQLKSTDIQLIEGVQCICINDSGKKQRLKNLNAKRIVPLHSALIAQGFLTFVEERKQHVQLFTYQPVGSNDHWSKTYCRQLAQLQTQIGMRANQRPTSYGFRHTFIDEMKQLDVSEHIVAQMVGHSNPNISYSRYGKDINAKTLVKYIAKINYDF
ncbi:hypothetical protein A9267_09805 [Shewanella sp. UCD-FRSSP16_17]|nr:hypothetical protein A9267_09805 [Shewanella sp. UCD-FRSSP16_17]